MKKHFLFLFFVVMLLLPYFSVHATEKYRTEAEHSIAVEATTGKILYEQEATTPTSIGSITNLLTIYLVYEAIEQGKLTLDTPVPISDYAYNLTITSPVTNIPLDKRSYPVQELIYASLIASANSATIALAEQVAGSEATFVDLMKEKLTSWGISDATILNSTGLSKDMLEDKQTSEEKEPIENRLSAIDVAIIARHLILDYPQVLKVTSQSHFSMNGTTYYGTNPMLKGGIYERSGLDGLKTASGTSMVATSLENGMRVITVVLHTKEGDLYPEKRFLETTNLMNYAYQYFTWTPIVEAGQAYQDSKVRVFNGKKSTIPAVAKQDLMVAKRNRYKKETTAKTNGLDTVLDAPLSKGTVLGTLTLNDTDLIGHGYIDEQPSIELVAAKDTATANWPFSWWNHFVRYVNEKL
ncbi:D-alanyl-D-alanine carboxypeptidase [Streptococcus sp. zg-86]|uniref:serine-type D-Ala-D-Ala carboxypeptidase n=1 Tax=Streptococcus zhangguiae TaxID=2664091 RepID=A0A6I4RUZ3_9STRE|nr:MULTISPECIES: D-alanyl-D-alanine carboxypeptidase PBP3 [unclassified Streptococcus]MTB65188.1 D-alanyl-D-alanine carboxypeptidase [Streptococcus sp. zg-86]MTB91497.1 D-alanyl-D-alanine carboxypeptidase [Streptococcus sp. zg-36]MWV57162.1 D-alanyl-D-alanine carboxypeptidase [Streptococcus sp. zg-70]QTH48106.1 D-alanyl-D-alanine carboxypeptidase PBP3 [Streptococcus sp. zg-86]